MHPAPSIIVFTTLSGFGFGLFFFLGLGAHPDAGWPAFWLFALAGGTSVIGLVASAFHLGHPERALRAFTQWRSSWLSREAWMSAISLTLAAAYGGMVVFFGIRLAPVGMALSAASLATIFATSMIYAQLKTVPRWHDWTTPLMFLLTGVAGAGVLIGDYYGLLAVGVAQILTWRRGDRRFSASGHTQETATGLGFRGKVRAFEPPHTGTNYLLNEMVHVVGRDHSFKLRVIGFILAIGLPALVLYLSQGTVAIGFALICHILGILAIRWLFFAEAEHVVGLYYGKR